MKNSQIFEMLLGCHLNSYFQQTEQESRADVLVLEGGTGLEQRLRKDGLIRYPSSLQFSPLSDYGDFMLQVKTVGPDNALVYDNENLQIAPVQLSADRLEDIGSVENHVINSIPVGSMAVGDDTFGPTARVAMDLAARYGKRNIFESLWTYMSRREPVPMYATVLQNSGCLLSDQGVIARFGPKGLQRAFFLEYAPTIFDAETMKEVGIGLSNNDGPYIDGARGVVGVLMTCKNGAGRYEPGVSEELVFVYGGNMYTAPIPVPIGNMFPQQEMQLEHTVMGGAPSCA